MLEFFGILFIFLVGILFGFLRGWTFAHKVVADECKLLNRFYVGKEVFHCVLVETKDDTK